MSSSRRSSRQASSSSRTSDAQITHLISNLRQSIPELRQNSRSNIPASKVLQEACKYVRKLKKEANDISGQLTQLLDSIDPNSPEAAIVRSLING